MATHGLEMSTSKAQAMLEDLAGVFLRGVKSEAANGDSAHSRQLPTPQAGYRSLVEQIPAVVFMVNLDRGVGEAYVSPHIEATLGYSQAEWLEDPIRWYRQIHPEDNVRWSAEAAEMLLTGNPLRSVYRVIARDGHVVWFHCEAKIVRNDDGEPWFIQGVAFDITQLKEAEAALQEERNFVSAILNTVGTLIMVLDVDGRVVQFNQACEQITSHKFEEVKGASAWELFPVAEERQQFQHACAELLDGGLPPKFEAHWATGDGGRRLISWSGTGLADAHGCIRHIIATGIDVTESKRLENAILDISAREQRRIGQDLHDGLGQHLTGIAFMSKVLEQKLADQALPESHAATKIVTLVNEAIHKTRELSRGLLPVVADALGLMSALEHYASEVEDLFGVECRFECDRPVLIHDDAVANHLYRIAQESVNNAIKHGHANHIRIDLSPLIDAGDEGISLSITDDGVGLPDDGASSAGMGLRIMNYRAKTMGGILRVQRSLQGGTAVTWRIMTAFPSPASCPKIRVLVVDDHPIVRQGLSQLISQEPDLMVCGQAEDARTALDAIDPSRPDIVIVDVSLEGPDGIELLKVIRAKDARLPVLILSMHDESLYAERALRAGANGYIMKQEATERVLVAIRQILGGEVYVSARMAKKMVQQFIAGSGVSTGSIVDELTDRELEVFRLIGQGQGTRQIAEKLHLSVKTVESYYAHIKEKLFLKNARELVQHAVQWVESGNPR